MRLLFTITLLASISAGAFASGGWQAATKVTSYSIEGEDTGTRIYVFLAQPVNPDNCPVGQLTRIYGDTAKGKLFFSTIMSAKAANQSVSALYNGCDDWGRSILTGLSVQP